MTKEVSNINLVLHWSHGSNLKQKLEIPGFWYHSRSKTDMIRTLKAILVFSGTYFYDYSGKKDFFFCQFAGKITVPLIRWLPFQWSLHALSSLRTTLSNFEFLNPMFSNYSWFKVNKRQISVVRSCPLCNRAVQRWCFSCSLNQGSKNFSNQPRENHKITPLYKGSWRFPHEG